MPRPRHRPPPANRPTRRRPCPRQADQLIPARPRPRRPRDHRHPAGVRRVAIAAPALRGPRRRVEPGWWPLVRYELVLCCRLGAGRARAVPALEAVSADPRPRRPQRGVRHQRRAAASAQDLGSATTWSIDDQCCLDAKGTTNRGIVLTGRRVPRPEHDPELQERRHRARGGGEHRVQRRDLLGGARARRAQGADRGLHVSRRRRSSLRSRRRSGACIRGGPLAASTSARTSGSAPTSSSPTACASAATPSIGAGAVVTREVPDFHVAAGVPARVVRDRRAPRAADAGN